MTKDPQRCACVFPEILILCSSFERGQQGLHSGSKLLHKTKTNLKTRCSSLTPEGTEPHVYFAVPQYVDRALTEVMCYVLGNLDEK